MKTRQLYTWKIGKSIITNMVAIMSTNTMQDKVQVQSGECRSDQLYLQK